MISKARLFINTSLLLAVLLMITSPLSAQPDNSRQIDSLKALFPKQEGVEKIESLHGLSNLVSETNLDSAIYFDSMALDIAIGKQEMKWVSKILTDISYYCFRKFDYTNAKILLDSALKICLKNNLKRQLFTVYNDFGNYYLEINLYDSALYHYQNALKLNIFLNEDLLPISLNNIGLVYYRLKNFELSIEYFNKALKLILENGNTSYFFEIYVNNGIAYSALGDFELAKKNLEKAVEIGKEHSPFYLSHAYDGLGFLYHQMNEKENAQRFYTLAIQASEKFKNKRSQANSYHNLAEIELSNKSFQNAKSLLNKSINLLKEIEDIKLMSVNYHLYSQLYEALDQPDSAYYYHKKYIALNDSIFTPKLIHNFTHLQLAYQAEESQQVIEEKEQRLSQTTKYLWLAGMVLLICVVQLFRFYHRFL